MKSMVKALTAMKRIFDRISFYLAILSACIVVVAMLSTMFSSFTRWMKLTFVGIDEFNAMLMGVVVYVAIAYAQHEKKHISVTLFTKGLSERVATILDIPLLTISAALFAWTSFLLYQSSIYALEISEVTIGSAHFPVFPLKLTMALGVTMLTVQLVIDIISRLSCLIAAPAPEAAKSVGNH